MNKSLSDLFFSLSLLVVFVICSVCLLLYQIQGYDELRTSSRMSEEQNLPISYLRTVFHQRAKDEVISKVMLDSTPCIRINDTLEDTTTYIYAYDGYLRELYVSSDSDVLLDDGDRLVPLDELQIEQKENVFTFVLNYHDVNTILHLTTY